MKFSIILFVFCFKSVLLFDSEREPKRWLSSGLRNNWPVIRNRPNDWISQWMKDRQRIPTFNPIRDLTESMEHMIRPQFDPSVVIVDKEPEPQEMHPFSDFGFPFGISFERPKFWSFGDMFETNKQWWKGPNVCTERRVIEGNEVTNSSKNSDLEVENGFSFHRFMTNSPSIQHSISLQSTHCTESETSYTCVSNVIRGRENKTTIVKHQCCHGFKRVANEYCTQVDLKDLIQTIKDLNSNRLMKIIERFGLTQELVTKNITVFAVTDDSILEFEDDNNKVENEIETEGQSLPSSVRRRRESDNNLKDIISMHLVPGLLKTGDFEDEQVLQTMSPTNKTIRINVYNNPKRVVTANCAPIISANNYATNGIVHIIDRVMTYPTKTMADIIENDQRFTILKNLLSKTDLTLKLREEGRPITLFAPTNDAFLKLEAIYLERLLKGQSCVEPFLLNHILNSTFCSSAVTTFASVKNALNIILPVKRFDEKLEIDGIPIIERDLLATNGIIHVIDGVLLSEKSQPISRYLEKHRMTEFLDLIKESDLLTEWDALQNVSFLIPSIEVLRTLPKRRLEYIKNNTKEMVDFLVIKPKTNVFEWNSNQMLDTISGNQIRVNTFGDTFGLRATKTAQCGKIFAQNEICGANIQIIDRFITPTKGNLIQVLDSLEKFSILRKIIKSSGLDEELQKGVYTLLALTDQSLTNQFSQNQIDFLISNKPESEKFIRNHLFPEVMCCSGVDSSPLFFSSQQIRNSEGSLISAHKSISGRVRFGRSRVTECDVMANNGVIHVINRVLESEPSFLPDVPFSFEFVI